MTKEKVGVRTHRDLDVWKKSMDFVTKLYKVTIDFPKSEIYGLTGQIRRSAVSIPSNIAEGAARESKKEYIRFLYIALGSVAEIETQLIIANNLQYLDDTSFNILDENKDEIGRMLYGLIRYRKTLLRGNETSDKKRSVT